MYLHPCTWHPLIQNIYIYISLSLTWSDPAVYVREDPAFDILFLSIIDKRRGGEVCAISSPAIPLSDFKTIWKKKKEKKKLHVLYIVNLVSKNSVPWHSKDAK